MQTASKRVKKYIKISQHKLFQCNTISINFSIASIEEYNLEIDVNQSYPNKTKKRRLRKEQVKIATLKERKIKKAPPGGIRFIVRNGNVQYVEQCTIFGGSFK